MTRAVFLDRDGVLNRTLLRNGKPYPPDTLEELQILPDVRQALGQLEDTHFLRIVVTNQPDVARGTQNRAVVEAMHNHLFQQLPLTEIIACYDDGDTAPCRKPNPGMLLQAAEKHQIDLPCSFMVGDRWRDIEAGRRAGCRTIFIDYNYNEPRPEPPADHTCASLAEAVIWIIMES